MLVICCFFHLGWDECYIGGLSRFGFLFGTYVFWCLVDQVGYFHSVHPCWVWVSLPVPFTYGWCFCVLFTWVWVDVLNIIVVRLLDIKLELGILRIIYCTYFIIIIFDLTSPKKQRAMFMLHFMRQHCLCFAIILRLSYSCHHWMPSCEHAYFQNTGDSADQRACSSHTGRSQSNALD